MSTQQIGASVTSTESALGAKTAGLGDRFTDKDGKEFVYVQADGAITAAGYVAIIDEAYQAVMVSTSVDAIGDLIGIAGVAFADNDYGWLQVKGPCLVRVAASCAANAPLNTTATAGQLDDDATASALVISGAVLTAAREASAGTAAGMLNYPSVVKDAAAAIAAAGVTATVAEINNAADVSARVQELTVSGAVTAGVQSVELNHASGAIAATVASAVNHPGLFVIKDTSATGTAAHTVTLTVGTFNGTNNVATLNARDECLIVYFDSAGRGQIIANVGAVGLS